MYRVILASVVALAAVAPTWRQPASVRIHVWTARGAIVDVDQKDREDSVKDLVAALDKTMFVSTSKDQSEIQVEVTTRAKAVSVRETTPILVPTIFATLHFGDYAAPLECQCPGNIRGMTWGAAAQACADQLKQWAIANVEQLRPSAPRQRQ